MTERAGSHPTEMISAWIDGELTPEERALVVDHLADCDACRALADDLATLAKATAAEPVPPVPVGLEERVAWRLRSVAKPAARSRWRTLVPLTAVASLMAVAILVVVLREQKLAPSEAFQLDRKDSETVAAPPAAPAPGSLDSLGSLDDKEKKDAAAGYVAPQKAPAPPQEPQTPLAEGRAKVERRDEAARQVQATTPVTETAKERAAAVAPAEVAGVQDGPDSGARDLAAAAAPSNEAESRAPDQGFAPAPMAGMAKSLAVRCRISWGVPEVLEARISRDRLDAIATRHGGTVTPDPSETSVYRVEVPVVGWETLSREIGLRGKLEAPPSDADCLRIGIRLLP